MSKWQPIATAPKDGTFILVIRSGKVPGLEKAFIPGVVQWVYDDEGVEGWEECPDCGPISPIVWKVTHWMPLPDPPEMDEKDIIR